MNKLVKNIEVKDSQSKHEIFKDDIATDKIFSVIDVVPIPDQKVLKLTLEGGDTIIIPGELADLSGLNPGEKRIKATDENGSEKISLILHDDGKIEVKNLTSDELIKLIHDLSTNLQTAVTDLISATVPTSLGPQNISVATFWANPVNGLLAKTVENTLKIELYKK